MILPFPGFGNRACGDTPSSAMRPVLLIALVLAGCKQVPVLPSLTPYKIDIQQGNHVTQEMVEKLRPGMTRAQVKFILGTPLVVDPFRNDRWDYVYLYNKAGEITEQRRVSILFENDRLKRIEGDVVAKGTAKESARATEETAGTAPGASPDERTPGIKPAAEPAPQKAPLPAASAQ